MGLDIPTNTVSLFFNVGNLMPLRNLQGQIDGQTPQQMEMFNKFLYPLETLTTDVSYPKTSAKSLFVHREMFFFYMRLFFSLTPSRSKEAVPLIPASGTEELALTNAIQMENRQSSAFLPEMHRQTFNISTLQLESMPFTLLLSKVKTNRLHQGQQWSRSEFSTGTLGGLSQVLGMGRDVEPVQMGTGDHSAFLQDGKGRGSQTPHPPCLSPASKSLSVILRGRM